MEDSSQSRTSDLLPSNVERAARLDAVLRQLEQRFGPWIVYRLRDARPIITAAGQTNQTIPTGSLTLDLLTGIGGLPRGRIVEFVGPPSSGKSSLAFHLLASAQRNKGLVTFIDAAHGASVEQMARTGVELADLFLVVPDSAPEALEVAALLVESGGLDALAIGPISELIRSSPVVGRQAALALARLSAVLVSSPTVVLFLTDDHARPAVIPFGRALRHFATLRVQVTPAHPIIHPSGDLVGLRVRLDTVKNKLAAGQRQFELDLRRDRGVHHEAELVDLGIALGLVQNTPPGLCFAEQILGRGRARSIATLERDSHLARELAAAIKRTWVG